FTIFVMISVPLGSLMAFGYIVSTETHDIRLGIFDGAQTALSRRIVAEMSANDTFEPVTITTRAGVEKALVGGDVGAALVIPPDFERDRYRAAGGGDEAATTQVLYDGAEPVLAGNIEASLRGILGAVLTDTAGEVSFRPIQGEGIHASVRAV